MPTDILLSSETVEHYTPPEIAQASRDVMGDIDLDPASCATANRVVQARCFCHKNGLDVAWSVQGEPARVFLNPPGGKLYPKTLEPMPRDGGPGLSAAAVWWWKLLDEYREGNVEQAVFLCFSLNVLQNSQEFDYEPPYRYPFVVPASRLRFWSERTPIGKGAPQHCNAIAYLPPAEGRRAAIERFREVFSQFGDVRV